MAQGYKTYFVSAHDLIIQLRKADSDGKLEKKLRSFVKPRLLIIDEMGYMKLDIGDAYYLFQVIARRYEKGPIILTSNKSFGEWGEMVGDPVIATAILDRGGIRKKEPTIYRTYKWQLFFLVKYRGNECKEYLLYE
ncbi:ATP-binding protein [Fictibacillus enclensis]|nr:ATP-binding protein [Fictibacillus enclensis]MDM5196526.1 ATP-binding protein [Fictibacillus enclensis]